jgi:hypothetical protein
MEYYKEVAQDRKGIRVNVDIKGLPIVKGLITVLGELVLDERIGEDIRMEYANKIISGATKGSRGIGGNIPPSL